MTAIGEFSLAAALMLGLNAWFSPEPVDRVILLPEDDGSVGRLVVNTASGSQELDQAYESAATDSRGIVATMSESADAVWARFTGLLGARPVPPRSYQLYFLTGGNELTEESKAKLAEIRMDVESRAAPEILVIGHTDRVGSESHNDVLSQSRALSVSKFLLEIGVQPVHIDATGRGERDLLVPTLDGVPEPRNRRVEISIR